MYGWELLMRIPFRACAIKFCEAVPPGKVLPCPFASDRKSFNIPLLLNLLPISDFGWGWKKMPLNGEEGRLGAHSSNKWWVKWHPLPSVIGNSYHASARNGCSKGDYQMLGALQILLWSLLPKCHHFLSFNILFSIYTHVKHLETKARMNSCH